MLNSNAKAFFHHLLNAYRSTYWYYFTNVNPIKKKRKNSEGGKSLFSGEDRDRVSTAAVPAKLQMSFH